MGDVYWTQNAFRVSLCKGCPKYMKYMRLKYMKYMKLKILCRCCFLPGRAKDLSAPLYIWWTVIHIGERRCSLLSGLLGSITFGVPAETLVRWPSCNSHVIVSDFNQNWNVSKILVDPLVPRPHSIKFFKNAFSHSVVVTDGQTDRQTWRSE